MKSKITILIGLIILLFANACSDFDDINDDPNAPKDPNTSYLFLGAVTTSLPYFHLTQIIGDVETLDPWNQLYPMYITWTDIPTNMGFIEIIQTLQIKLGMTSYAAGPFYIDPINNLDTIIRLNTSAKFQNESYVKQFCQSNNNQIAVARTLKAYIYMHLTDALGMLPYSQAMRGREGIFEPAYDDQQSIYTDLDKELNEAYAQFEEQYPLDAGIDIVYGGDIAKWKKFNASVRMMLAIKLWKNDTENGKNRFAKAYADGFIRNNADIFKYQHLNEVESQHPLSLAINDKRFYPSAVLIDTLKLYNDPRLQAYVATNNEGQFRGLGYLMPMSPTISYSYFNTNYYKADAPAVLVTPSVMLLAAAEAAERGWITANPEDLYKEAITAAFAQHGITASVDDYYNQPLVTYTGSSTAKIRKIAMQKWIASYMQDGFEAFSDRRRLGVPVSPTLYSVISISMPRRVMYHTDDYIANENQYNAAISKQGPDAQATRVWWDK